MTYYAYISDSKVDMLLPQIPESDKKKISAEIGFDVKILKASFKEEVTTLDNRVSRLRAVESYLLTKTKHEVGPLQNSAIKKWIFDEQLAKFINIGDGVMICVGKSGEITFCLGGSSHNVIGNVSTGKIGRSYSFLPDLISIFSRYANDHTVLFKASDEQVHGYFTKPFAQGSDAWMSVIQLGLADNIPYQKVKFLARKLIYDPRVYTGILVLATPLYISLE